MKLNLWAWAPAGILILFLATRLGMLHYMRDVPVDRTVEDSYIASASFGANQEARRQFKAHFALHYQNGALNLDGPTQSLQRVSIHFRHPARAGLDRTLAWDDPTQPLDLTELPPGLWQLTLTRANMPTSGDTPVALRYEQPLSR